MIDLGFLGDVYVAGLTLEQVELKISHQATMAAIQQNVKISQPYRVSVRLANSQSKFYYVMGTVNTQGRFPIRATRRCSTPSSRRGSSPTACRRRPIWSARIPSAAMTRS